MQKKIFQDIEKQIEILKGKGLLFKDEEKAKTLLIKTNYYTLINGYRLPFVEDIKNEDGTRYKKGAFFDEIYYFYAFELNLKTIFLKYIFYLEQNIKSAISYEFSRIHGYENYLQVGNFDNSSYGSTKDIFYLFSNLYNTISRSISKEDYISYYVENYNYIPLWVLVNSMSLGNAINFYKLMKSSEKDYVSKYYFNCKSYELEDYLEILNAYRNICAHDERLYNFRAKGKSVPINKFHEKFKIVNKDIGKNDPFSLLIALLDLLIKEDAFKVFYELDNLFKDFEKKLESMKITEILDFMGFPENWRDIREII